MSVEQNNKIKVLRIIARLNIGGPAIHTILLTEGLDRSLFNSVLVTGLVSEGEGDMSYFAKERDVRPIIIPQLKREINPVNDFIAFIKIYNLIKKERPEIIHTHTSKAGSLGRSAAIIYNFFHPGHKCKIVHTFHGTVLEGYFGRLKSKAFICTERLLAFFTDRIVVVSELIKNEILKLGIGDNEKIKIVNLGLDIEELLTLKQHDKIAPLTIGIVGRLVPIKNHKMFLEAVKLFKDHSNPFLNSCKFLVIGDGQLKKELMAYSCKLGTDGLVEFCGWRCDTTKVYSLLDIVVLTSLNEGTPVSLIEAMSAQKPIIATDVGGARDLFIEESKFRLNATNRLKIYGNGILCKSKDSAGFCEAMSLLAQNPSLRKEMGQIGRAFAKDRFSKERLIKDIELLYNYLLK